MLAAITKTPMAATTAFRIRFPLQLRWFTRRPSGIASEFNAVFHGQQRRNLHKRMEPLHNGSIIVSSAHNLIIGLRVGMRFTDDLLRSRYNSASNEHSDHFFKAFQI